MGKELSQEELTDIATRQLIHSVALEPEAQGRIVDMSFTYRQRLHLKTIGVISATADLDALGRHDRAIEVFNAQKELQR